jgi:hypothetical protein
MKVPVMRTVEMLVRCKLHLIYAMTIIAILITIGGGKPTVHAQQTNQVGLVIQFGNGDLITRCIEFNESEISGYEVLERAGLNIVVNFDSGMGAGICGIEGEGCPADSCMTCDVPNYWSYWHLSGESWTYSQKGASSYRVQHSDVEGWRWGDGDPPPVIQFDQICAPPTNTPVPSTSTPPPTETPQPKPEDTAIPELVVWFRLDQNPIPAGSCTMVRWDTTNAKEVYLDGEKVSLIGNREVCPTEPQEYNLRVVGAEDEETHTLVLGVTGSLTPSPTAQPTAVPPSPTPTAQAATTAPPSPTPAATTTSLPTPSPTTQPTPTPSPSPTPEATASPSPTPPRATQTTPTRTPTRAPQPEPADQSPADSAGSTSFYRPASYALFALIVGGLLGWLIFLAKVRK